jgi:MFS family permease
LAALDPGLEELADLYADEMDRVPLTTAIMYSYCHAYFSLSRQGPQNVEHVRMSRSAAVRALDPRLVRLWLTQVPTWFGWAGSLVVVGWLVFGASGSAILVSLAYTARLAPLVITGVPVAAWADRFGRVGALIVANGAAALLCLTLVAVAAMPSPLPLLLVASVGLGMTDAVRMAVGPNLAYSLSSALHPTRAIAVLGLLAGGGQVLGGAVAGGALDLAGPTAASLVVAAVFLLAALALVGVDVPRSAPRARSAFLSEIVDGLALVTRSPTTAVLVGVAIALELFAFSGIGLDPVFAGAVFVAGPAGLGLISATRAGGRLLGGLLLALRSGPLRAGQWLAAGIVLFGVALAGYAASPTLAWALPCLVAAGLAGALVDVLEQSALQASVAPEARGRATGLWVVSVGLGPIGVLLAGGLAQTVGPRPMQGGFGLLVAALGILLLTRLRRAVADVGGLSEGPPYP